MEAGAYFEYPNQQQQTQLAFLSGEQYERLKKACGPQCATDSCWKQAGLEGVVTLEDYTYG